MQAQSGWFPPQGTLGLLIRAAEVRVESLLARRRELERAATSAPSPPPFEASLRLATERGTIAVIAEIKRSSPSKGVLNASIDAAEQARQFASGGAAAVSVLTEPDRFGGSPEDLTRARAAIALPLVKKDFHIHPVQAAEARAIGASALLLIARALGPHGLATMAGAARDAGVEILVEVRDASELDWALSVDARVIGVNNRDLETLVIDTEAGERVIPLIPHDLVAIAESGIRGVVDAEAAAQLGSDAVLVGSVLSAAHDPAEIVRALSSVAWRGRGR